MALRSKRCPESGQSAAMKTTLLFTLVALSIAFNANAQAPADDCGFHGLFERDLTEDPQFARSWFALEQRMLQMQEMPALRNEEILTIPVVFHVIHVGEEYGWMSNVPDEQLFSAIEALNEDFRKLPGSNGDGVGVDTGIEFCLAKRDPNGNPTTGIVRVDGSSVPEYAENGIQATGDVGAGEIAVKSLSNWPYQDYLNIWVVSEIEGNNAQSGIQGYSRFPVPSMVDGVVVLYNATGTTGNIKSSTALNRTVTHEVGHYLGLYHTFHLTSSCTPESNCATQGDRVCDTPQTTQSPSCNTLGCGQQMVENYMDYTAQTCMNAFTDGQRTRMRNTLIIDRATLLESLGCAAVTEHDAGIAQIVAPTGSTCSPLVTPVVRLTNYGSAPLTSCTIHYSTNNENFAQFSWTGNLGSGSSVNVELPQIAGINGDNELSAWVMNPNGQTDQAADNNEALGTFAVASGGTVTLSISVDFFGSETTWAMTQNGTVVASGGPYINNAQGTVFVTDVCLPEGCYELTMFDAYEDGQSFTQGWYSLANEDGTVLANGSGNWGASATHAFCVDAAEVVLPDPPVAAFTASATSGCNTLSVNFTSTSTGATSYQWSFPGGSPSSSNLPNPTVNYSGPGSYTVTLNVTNEGGSDVETQSGFIVVGASPTVNLTATHPACNTGNTGSLQANASGGGPFTYAWSSGQSTSSISGLGAGSYSVTVTNAQGCTANASATLVAPAALNATVFKSDATCYGEADGSASASASGGTPPYTYSWNTGANTSSIQNLGPGNVGVIVTDANGCTASANATIQQPSEITFTVSDITAETCTGNDGGAVVNAMGGSGQLTVTWSNGNMGAQLTDASAGTYTATISDAQGCSTSTTVSIGFDCVSTVPTTRLDDASCSATGLYLHNTIQCIPVAEAVMYQWRFQSPQIGLTAEGYTANDNTSYLLEQISPNIRYGIDLIVTLRVLSSDETWSDWGEACTISLADNIPVTQVAMNDCALGTVLPNGMLSAEDVAGALEFEWRFVNGSNEHFAISYLPELIVSSNIGLVEGLDYTVAVRVQVGGEWSTWGDTCTLRYGETVGTTELVNAVSMSVYPNPSNGDKIFIAYRNLMQTNDVIDIEVYDGSGKLIENNQLSSIATQGELTLQFRRKLAPGMYFLKARMSGRIFEEKIIVQ